MAKLTLTDITSLANTASAKQALNDNFTAIETAIEKTLSRDGTAPNQMTADIDLNDNDLLNVKRIDADEIFKNGVPFEQVVAYSNKQFQLFNGTGVQTVFILNQDPGSLGNLYVSVGGLDLKPGIDYNYSGTTLTFVVAPASGTNNIYVRYDQALPTGVTTADGVSYTPPSTGIASSVKVFLDSLWLSTGASFINWARTTTGAITRTLLGKVSDLPVHLLDYVPVAEHAAILAGTSTFDCGPALANAIAAAQANTLSANEVILPKGLINVAQTYTLTSPVRFTGQGGAGAPTFSTFPVVLGTQIKYTGADTNAVLFTFNNVNYGGAGMHNLSLNGNGVAKRGLILDAVLGFSSEGLQVTRFTNVLVGLISSGGTTSWNQFKNLYLEGEVDGTSGATCLWLSGGNGGGGSGANASHNTFENLHINHGGLRSGIYLGGVDNIVFTQTYIFRASGTRPGVEVVHEQQGGVWFPVANTFVGLEAGLGGWVEPAGGNATFPTACIYGYQTDNGQPLPVVDSSRRLPFTTNSGDVLGVRSIGKTSFGADWAGSVTALNGTTSTAVSFPSGARSSAAYIVVLNSPTTTGFAIQSKTTTGFTIAWASALSGNHSVDWLILGG